MILYIIVCNQSLYSIICYTDIYNSTALVDRDDTICGIWDLYEKYLWIYLILLLTGFVGFVYYWKFNFLIDHLINALLMILEFGLDFLL